MEREQYSNTQLSDALRERGLIEFFLQVSRILVNLNRAGARKLLLRPAAACQRYRLDTGLERSLNVPLCIAERNALSASDA